MISLLEIYEELPEVEKQFVDIKGLIQQKKADRSLWLIPEPLRKYYQCQFSTGIPRRETEGDFVGICCGTCNRWLEFGHKEECPVAALTPPIDYRAISKRIAEIVKGD